VKHEIGSRGPSVGGAPPPTKGEHTRRAILDAAIVRFGREGYRATSVADIAREASVGGTVAYAYFPNKEALFLAAADEDAAAVISEGLTELITEGPVSQMCGSVILTILAAVGHHPLARRLLAGLEPEVTVRLLEIPALEELRKVSAERIRSEQLEGNVRPDVDPATMANAIVAVMLSLLMSAVQLGADGVARYGADIAALFTAAVELPRPGVPAASMDLGAS
jgi:AcrR family transcriptional regulator